MTKKFRTKLKYKFEKEVSLGIFLLLFSAGLGWDIKPTFFYQQKAGTVVDITESQKRISKGKYTSGYYYLDIYIFNIDGKKIETWKENSENYDYLLGKTIKYKSFRRYKSFRYFGDEHFAEIIYNNQTIYSSDEHIKWFVVCIVVFTLSLFWCIWAVVRKWKDSVTPAKKNNNNDEEFFFDTWGIRKKNNKCTFSYISRLDGSVKHIKIRMEDYDAAKDGTMNLNDFSDKYNLW